MVNPITIRRASIGDAQKIELMLREAGIDPVGLGQWVESFLIAEVKGETDSEIIATAGLETYGSKGLLRSLVIRKQVWNAEKALHMLWLIIAYVGQNGLSELYLLTESPALFIHMGFTQLPPGDVPSELLSSKHFQQNRRKAVPMRKILH